MSTPKAVDIDSTIAANSDQLGAEDFLAGPSIVTISETRIVGGDQPVEIVTQEFGPKRPFKPSKTVRRILVAAWGKHSSEYVGRRMMLYRDASVTFGGQAVGGIRVSALSHIDEPVTVALTVTRGRRAPHTVEPLAVEYQPIPESFATKVRAGGLTDDERASAIAYLSKLSNADPAEVAELNALIDQESTNGQ